MNDQSILDLDLYERFQKMFQRRLAEIPVQTIVGTGWAEDVGDKHFTEQGFQVFHSHAKNGYRCIVDWAVNFHRYSPKAKAIVNAIHTALPANEFALLVNAVRDKTGTPDLLLLKDKRVSFVEVKNGREEVKPCTIKFYIRYSHLWPLTLLRVNAKHPIDDLVEQFS